jgi:competence protein ComEC
MDRLRRAVYCCGFLGITLFANGQSLRIYHIDVEQGASTLLVSPAGRTLLIDAGKNGHGARIKAVLQQAGATRINHFVVTHYHEDHYGGADELAPFVIDKAYDRGHKDEFSDAERAEPRFAEYEAAVGQNAEELAPGGLVPLDPAMIVTCVASDGIVTGEMNGAPAEDENDKSIALYIQFGDFRFFIGGDIEVTTEGKIAAHDLVADVDLYQANHHGAETSSSLPLMLDLTPAVVVISNGNNGKYRHPRQHTLNVLAGLTPRPRVFQTNKYLKGGSGGNVEDAFIADLASTQQDGTILTTISFAPRQMTVAYRDETHTFPIKVRAPAGPPAPQVVIESLLPDPTDGFDRDAERVTLRNRGSGPISMAGWMLKDRDNVAWALGSLGTLNAGQSKTIRRNGMAMNLNNSGDKITLFAPGNERQDEFEYANSLPGVTIPTGH